MLQRSYAQMPWLYAINNGGCLRLCQHTHRAEINLYWTHVNVNYIYSAYISAAAVVVVVVVVVVARLPTTRGTCFDTHDLFLAWKMWKRLETNSLSTAPDPHAIER